jgi:uncharacterized protein (DUF433 family)
MGARRAVERDPLLSGFYSERDAARLLRMDSARRVHGWLNGWGPKGAAPIIQRDFADTSSVSFLDLMEIRFVEHFRQQGVPLQTLRRAAERARAEWKTEHPFALSKVRYLTDRRKVFGQAAQDTGDKVTWDLVTNQLEMWDAIENLISKGVEFDPSSDLAHRWTPLRNDCPNVIIDPRLAFGRPVIGKAGVPTVALFRQWRAEAGNADRVARSFRVSPAEVQQAVEFEMLIAA